MNMYVKNYEGRLRVAKILLHKFKESMISVLPVAVLVVILNFTPLINLSGLEILVFLISAVFLIIGIGMFNLGADLAMTPMGENAGAGLAKSRKLWLLLSACPPMEKESSVKVAFIPSE